MQNSQCNEAPNSLGNRRRYIDFHGRGTVIQYSNDYWSIENQNIVVGDNTLNVIQKTHKGKKKTNIWIFFSRAISQLM